MKVGAQRDYTLVVAQGAILTGEPGLLFRFQRGDEKFLMFFGKDEVGELRAILREAQLELERRPDR